VLQQRGVHNIDELLSGIGLGNHIAIMIARALMGGEEEQAEGTKGGGPRPRPLAIKGTEGTVVSFAKCCRPIPGDPILGFVRAGRGFVIHTQDCKNVVDYRDRPERWIDVEWERDINGDFPVYIRMLVVNQRGALATIAASVSEHDANIDNVTMEERDGMYSTLSFTIAVYDRQHLARIMRSLRSHEMVMRIQRAKG
jgi:(p)ppGpp synthase/HD superfamily hydrolase